MIGVAVFAVSVLLAGASELEPPQPALVRVLYSPFRLSCWSLLSAFEENALCKFERDANDPAMQRVLQIVTSAPEIKDGSATFSKQWVRLSIRGLGQAYHVDKQGRVEVVPNKPGRQLSKVALTELESALVEMCPRLKRQKEAREAAAGRTSRAAGKAK